MNQCISRILLLAGAYLCTSTPILGEERYHNPSPREDPPTRVSTAWRTSLALNQADLPTLLHELLDATEQLEEKQFDSLVSEFRNGGFVTRVVGLTQQRNREATIVVTPAGRIYGQYFSIELILKEQEGQAITIKTRATVNPQTEISKWSNDSVFPKQSVLSLIQKCLLKRNDAEEFPFLQQIGITLERTRGLRSELDVWIFKVSVTLLKIPNVPMASRECLYYGVCGLRGGVNVDGMSLKPTDRVLRSDVRFSAKEAAITDSHGGQIWELQ